VQKDGRRTIGRTSFGISDIQKAGIDLLLRCERRVRARLDGGTLGGVLLPGCAAAEPIMTSSAAAMVWPQCPKSGGDDD
jgi:hypothetical protein